MMQQSKVNTDLFTLCQQGDLNGVHYLISHFNGDVNYQNEWGDTLLSISYRQGHWHLFNYLLAQENFDVTRHNVWLYLFDAADKGYVEPVRLLSRLCSTKDLNDALVIACLSGNLTVIEWLVLNFSVNIYYSNSNGVTPLSAAISRDQWQVINYLTTACRMTPSELDVLKCMRQAAGEGRLDKIQVLIRFSNLTILSECLLTSCLCGHVNVVHWLLCNTLADFKYEDILGFTPFTIACNQGHWDIVKCFVDTKRLDLSQANTWVYLLATAGRNIPEIAIYYIIQFSSVEQRNAALINSCEEGNLNVAELLVSKAGADINCRKYSWGMSTLRAACSNRNWHIVNYLISTPTFDPTKHEIDDILFDALCFSSIEGFKYLAVFVTESVLNELLYDACKFGEREIVTWLVANTNVDVNFEREDNDDKDDTVDSDDDYNSTSSASDESTQTLWWSSCSDHTPVSIACRKEHWDIVKCLIQSPTFVGYKHCCWRLLLAASLAEQDEEVKIFAQYCSNDEVINDALVIACKLDNLNIVQWLVSVCDADVNHHSYIHDGKTCLTVACEEWNWDIVKFLVQLPHIDREEHELCEYIFEKVDENNFEKNDLIQAYLQAERLRDLYDSDDDEVLWESLSNPEE